RSAGGNHVIGVLRERSREVLPSSSARMTSAARCKASQRFRNEYDHKRSLEVIHLCTSHRVSSPPRAAPAGTSANHLLPEKRRQPPASVRDKPCSMLVGDRPLNQRLHPCYAN